MTGFVPFPRAILLTPSLTGFLSSTCLHTSITTFQIHTKTEEIIHNSKIVGNFEKYQLRSYLRLDANVDSAILWFTFTKMNICMIKFVSRFEKYFSISLFSLSESSLLCPSFNSIVKWWGLFIFYSANCWEMGDPNLIEENSIYIEIEITVNIGNIFSPPFNHHSNH